MGIFKSYDIRGIYPEEWSRDTAYRIGFFLPALLKAPEVRSEGACVPGGGCACVSAQSGRAGRAPRAQEILVGRDVRRSSAEIFAALSAGIRDAGCGVVDIGLCTTPSLYFATTRWPVDGSVMITASHNPPQYNGLKISRREAIPVGYESGLADLERMIGGEVRPARRKGPLRTLDIRSEYLAFLAPYGRGIGPLRVVVDCSNGMAGLFLGDVFRDIPARIIPLYEEPDGRFPHHEPNPLQEENLADLKKRTVEEKADLGICFDGDADRVVFVDERGRFVSPDLIIGVLGLHFFSGREPPRRRPIALLQSRFAALLGRSSSLRSERGRLRLLHGRRRHGGPPWPPPARAVSYDVRSSRGVVEFIRELGGEPVMCRVGHSHAKKLLREIDGLFGGELAGHYYFRDNAWCDSAMIAALLVLSILSREKVPFSRLIERVRRYHHSGEINFRVEDKDGAIRRILADYPDGTLSTLDGIRIDYPTWWFNLRKSNTEPYLRLVVEATGARELDERVRELKGKIEPKEGKRADA